jgi:hypothetical protein
MNRHSTWAALAAIVVMVGIGTLMVIPSVADGADEGPVIAFRAKASLLPADAALVKGKAPEDVVEITIPGRVYESPIKVAPVKTRRDANWKTPEQASASDFSAMRAADPEWLRENFMDEDYPQIKRMVEDPNIRRLNQSTYMGYGEKTIVARGQYKDFALVFAQYDRVSTSGTVEAYQKVKGSWKRTNSLAKDETVSLLQTMFRQGTFEQIGR